MSIDRNQVLTYQEKVSRRKQLKEEIVQLRQEVEKLETSLSALYIDMHNEQVDVDLLNTFSLKNIYYDLTGKKETLLHKEASEARAAKEKYDQAVFQIDRKKAQLQEATDAFYSLTGVEAAYWMVLNDSLTTAAGEYRSFLLDLRCHRKDAILAELDTAAQDAVIHLESAEKTLEQISNVSKWNLSLSGSAWDMTIPGYLIGCQKKIEELQKQMRLFLWNLTGLPLPSPLPDEILIFPENYLKELAGKIGADERLCEADTAIREAKKQLNLVLDQISQAQNHLITEI